MILQALYELAQREKLVPDPDYEPKSVSWKVRVTKDGRILFPLQDNRSLPPEEPDAKRKRKLKPIPGKLNLPREKPMVSDADSRAFLLFGKAEHVFGVDPTGKRGANRLTARFKLFRERVKECLDATGDEAAAAVLKALEAVASGHQKLALPPDLASNDLFAFVYEPDVDILVTDRPRVKAFWRSQRARSSGDSDTHTCLVSGEDFSGAVGNFPPVMMAVGKRKERTTLVSFNKNAFESYGWAGNENAPISRAAAEASATALARLLDTAYPDPLQPGVTLPRRNLRVSDDTVVCFWAAQPNGDSFCDAFTDLIEASKPDEVAEMYRSIWRGKSSLPEDESAFYALVISGAKGRAAVRDWIESTIWRVSANLARHFGDLEIVRNTHPGQDRKLPPQFALTLLLRSLAPQGDRDKIPSPRISQMVRAALRGTPYPISLLQLALERERAEQGMKDWDDENRRDARAAVIKAVLNRRRRASPDTANYEEVRKEMDPANNNEGYVLGKMMAVVERIQQAAQPSVNTTVVDRYFSGASAAPRSVFVRLLKNARHHVSKAKDDEKTAGLAFRLDRLLDSLSNSFDVKNNGFPAFLDLNHQGLFVLGYHQMRHWLWLSGEEREAWEKAHQDAPTAYLWRTGKSTRQEEN
jgi:CRISPR-associated protein Csd1